jgi:hypothetical protein
LFVGGNEAMTNIEEGAGQPVRHKPQKLAQHKRANAQRSGQALLAVAAEAGEISADIEGWPCFTALPLVCFAFVTLTVVVNKALGA